MVSIRFEFMPCNFSALITSAESTKSLKIILLYTYKWVYGVDVFSRFLF